MQSPSSPFVTCCLQGTHKVGSSWGVECGWCGCGNGEQLYPAKLSSAVSQGLGAGTEPTWQSFACPVPALQWMVSLSTWSADDHHLCDFMPVDEQSTEPTVGLPQEQEGFISDAGFAAFSPVGSAWPQRQGVCRGGGIPNGLPGAAEGGWQEAATCTWCARAAQPGSGTGDMPRTLHGACAAVS